MSCLDKQSSQYRAHISDVDFFNILGDGLRLFRSYRMIIILGMVRIENGLIG